MKGESIHYNIVELSVKIIFLWIMANICFLISIVVFAIKGLDVNDDNDDIFDIFLSLCLSSETVNLILMQNHADKLYNKWVHFINFDENYIYNK